MADIPSALVQCLTLFSEPQVTSYWNQLVAVQLKHSTEISSFCDFLCHSIHQIIANYPEDTESKSDNDSELIRSQQLRLWKFRESVIASYGILCSSYLRCYSKQQITVTLSEWSTFWISHYVRPLGEAAMDRNMVKPLAIDKDSGDSTVETKLDVFSKFLFGTISLKVPSTKIKISSSNRNKSKVVDPHLIPSVVMNKMKLPSSVLSLYLELFLLWFVTEQSHKWQFTPQCLPEIDVDILLTEQPKDGSTSRWDRMTRQMKVKLYGDDDGSVYPGYHWKYLLDFDALQHWLNSSRVSGFSEITADWTHERFDQFLSNPLNRIEQKYLPTLKC